ncbi:MAG: cytochrome c biogenesis protein CcsA [Candidatus Aquicultorales bacterium]
MNWGGCFTHAILGLLSYVLFIVAAVGGGTYLFVEWYKPLHELEDFREEMQDVRLKANLMYLGIGIAFFAAAIVLGAMRAKVDWGSYWSFEAKETASAIMLFYYVVAAGFMAAETQLPGKHYGKIGSVLVIAGVPLILINGLVINFFVSSLHRYL